MKKLFAILLVSGAFVACNNAPENTENTETVPETVEAPAVDSTAAPMMDSTTVPMDSTHVH